MEETQTIAFLKPVKLGEITYDKVELREPTAGELDRALAGQNNIAITINLISLVGKMPRKAVEALGQRDLKACADFLESFTSGSPPTGGQP